MNNEYYRQDCWYPDNSGEWIEYDGSGQPVEDDVPVEVLLQGERKIRQWIKGRRFALNWSWVYEDGDDKIVAYKIVK